MSKGFISLLRDWMGVYANFWDWYKSKIQEPEQSWIRFFSNRRRLDFGTGLRRWKWQNTAGQGLAVRALIMASRD